MELGAEPDANAVLLFGDFNNDAYDDLSVTLKINDQPRAVLLENIECLD